MHNQASATLDSIVASCKTWDVTLHAIVSRGVIRVYVNDAKELVFLMSDGESINVGALGTIVGMRVYNGYIQYMTNQDGWINLISLDDLKVPSGEGSASFETDDTLSFRNGILSVNTTDGVEPDNTLPITSAGVFATVGNIEALLKTI